MANVLKLKRSAVARRIPGPADLTLGELRVVPALLEPADDEDVLRVGRDGVVLAHWFAPLR